MKIANQHDKHNSYTNGSVVPVSKPSSKMPGGVVMCLVRFIPRKKHRL